MDQALITVIASAVPTLAVVLAIVRNESATGSINARITGLEGRINSLENRLDVRITSLENRLDYRIETLDRDLRDWAKITMQHNTDIARLKEQTGLD